MKKVSLRIEDEILEVLMTLCETDNVSGAVRIAIQSYLQNDDGLQKVKTLFPYIGKKPPRIGREVAEAFAQSDCNIFADLFCGSLAMLCYLPWDTKVVVNDINGNLTNLYQIIRDRPSAFICEAMKLPYSEVLFKQFSEELKSGIDMINMATAYQKNLKWILQLSRRLQTVEILNRDFRYVLKQYNSKDVFVYADCPYMGTAVANNKVKENDQLEKVDKELELMYHSLGFTLTTIPGVNITTAVKMLAEIGDIHRFSNAAKLARFAGMAPLRLSSADKGVDKATKQGNRRLQAIIYFLAVRMIQVSTKGKPRNPAFRAYYDRRINEGKNAKQVLICISRRLVNIIYGMLKNGTDYVMPEVKESIENNNMDSNEK